MGYPTCDVDGMLAGEGMAPMTDEANCFYCGEPTVLGGYVEWMGRTGEIRLHPTCGTDLMLRLSSDLHHLQTGRPVRL